MKIPHVAAPTAAAGLAMGYAALSLAGAGALGDCVAYAFDGQCWTNLLALGMSSAIGSGTPPLGGTLDGLIFDVHMALVDLIPKATRRELPTW